MKKKFPAEDSQFVYTLEATYCRKCETRAMPSAAAHMMLHRYFLNDKHGNPELKGRVEILVEVA
jgi:hypothetical protein